MNSICDKNFRPDSENSLRNKRTRQNNIQLKLFLNELNLLFFKHLNIALTHKENLLQTTKMSFQNFKIRN